MLHEVFYKALGADGILALRETIKTIHRIVPNVPVILGVYGGDIGHSNLALIEYAFEYLDADGITINPYFGQEALQPLLDLGNKGIIVLCRTSNYGAMELQGIVSRENEVPFYRTVAWRVSQYWNEKHRNCALLIGATSHGELSKIRSTVCRLPIFVTGIGPQSKTGKIEKDDVREIVINGRNGDGLGFVVCSSRGIIFADDPHTEAANLHKLINRYRAELL